MKVRLLEPPGNGRSDRTRPLVLMVSLAAAFGIVGPVASADPGEVGSSAATGPPTVSTVSVDRVGQVDADLSATVNPNGGATTYEFQIRLGGLTEWTSFGGGTTGDGTEPVTVRATATGLLLDSLYEVRLRGVNAAGESVSPALSTIVVWEFPIFLSVNDVEAKVGKRSLVVSSRVRVPGDGVIAQRVTSGQGQGRTWCERSKPVPGTGNYAMRCNLGRKGRAQLRKKALGLTLRTTFSRPNGLSVENDQALRVERRK